MSEQKNGNTWKWVVGLLVTITLALVTIYVNAQSDRDNKQENRIATLEQSSAEYKTDIKYIREGITEIKGKLK